MGIMTYIALHLPFHNEEGKPVLPPGVKAAKTDDRIKIFSDTDIVQKIFYLKCGDEEVVHLKPAENLIGLNKNQLQAMYPEWTIDKFDNRQVEMTLRTDNFCQQHADHMYVGLKDGHVTVFYGKPGGKPVVKEITKMAENRLMPQDVKELQRGIVVRSEEELLQTLEGLQAR
jgi:hypothetical protein